MKFVYQAGLQGLPKVQFTPRGEAPWQVSTFRSPVSTPIPRR
jgi:hypothetical protein